MTNFSFFRISKVRTLGASALLALAVFFASCEGSLVSDSIDNAPAGVLSANIVGAGTGTISAAVISGSVGIKLAPQTLDIILSTNWVAPTITVGTGVNWFPNIPTGLGGTVTALTPLGGSAPGGTVTVEITGTPSAVSSFWIDATIPASDLSIGVAPITIPPVSTVAYDIDWSHTAWTQSSTSPFSTAAVNAVAYGDGTYLVSSYANASAAYSTDGGLTWTAVSAATTGMGTYFPYILFVPGSNNDPGTFYAVGAGGNIRTTTVDGLENEDTWDPAGSSLIDSNDIRGIAYNAEQDVTFIVGNDGYVSWTSGLPDGPAPKWTALQLISDGTALNSVATGEIDGTTVVVVTGQNGFSAYAIDNFSFLSDWTITSDETQNIFGYEGGPAGIKQVAFNGNRRFVAVGYARTAYIDFNANPVASYWTGVSVEELLTFAPSRTAWLNCVTYGGGFFVAGGSQGVSIMSVDGVNWAVTGAVSEFSTSSDSFVNNIAYNPDGPFDVYMIGGNLNAGPGVAAFNTN